MGNLDKNFHRVSIYMSLTDKALGYIVWIFTDGSGESYGQSPVKYSPSHAEGVGSRKFSEVGWG